MSGFFITDGPLALDALSYVERAADRDVLNGLLSGQFCSVFSPKQTGKSSLMLRAAHQLRRRGIHVVTLESSALLSGATPEAWHEALNQRVAEQLGMQSELAGFWVSNSNLPPGRRWFASLGQIVLPRLKARDEAAAPAAKAARAPATLSDFAAASGRLVIFIDDVDALRNCPFSTHEFFAEMEACRHARTQDAELRRLTFCVLGIAAPDTFLNAGIRSAIRLDRPIELENFTVEQTAALAPGLKPRPVAVSESELSDTPKPRVQFQFANSEKILLERVHYWTGGHPYLTQRLCQALSDCLNKPAAGQSSLATRDLVDQQCNEVFFRREARAADVHLRFLDRAILENATERAGLLHFYAQVLKSERPAMSGPNAAPAEALLRSGIVRAGNGSLRPCNRIYERVFDDVWIEQNMPEAELRRQRAAVRKSTMRVLVVAGIACAALGALALVSFRETRLATESAQRSAQTARQTRDRLVQLTVANGARLVDQGALLSALPWFAEAMKLVEDDPVQEEVHRFRLHALLGQGARLAQVCVQAGPIHWAEFSADGRWLVTASEDRTAQVWDLTSGERLTAPLRHAAAVLRATFSSDGSRVVTACADGTARIWETETGKEMTPPLTHGQSVLCVRFNRKGDRVVTASADGTARVWNAANGEPVTPPISHQGSVGEAVFSPDGRRLATASADQSARVWDAVTGLPVAPPLAHQGAVTSVSFGSDGTRLVTSSADGTVRIWDAATGRALLAPLKHNGPVSHAAFSPDGGRILTLGINDGARLWNAATGQPIPSNWSVHPPVAQAVLSPDGRCVLTAQASLAQVWDAGAGEQVLPSLEHTSPLTFVAFNEDGSQLVTGCANGTVRVWNIAAPLAERLVLRHKSGVAHAAFHPDGDKIVTASSDGVVQVWNALWGNPLAQVWIHSGFVYRALFGPDGSRILTACEDGGARLEDARTGQSIGQAIVHEGPVHQVAFSSNGRQLVTASYDQTARVWSTETGIAVTPPLRHQANVADVSFSPSGDRVLTASWDQTVRVWDPGTGRELGPVLQLPARVSHAAFSFDGRRIVTASGDEVRVWDAATGQPITPPLRHEGEITAVAFSPDNRYLLSASRDSTARLWNAATGAPMTGWLKHRQPITHAAFSPDGLRVATASWDGAAQIWDVFTGQPAGPPFRHGAAVTFLAFSPNGHRLVTTSLDQTARVWDLPADERPAPALAAWAEVTSEQRIDRSGVLTSVDLVSLRTTLAQLRSKYPTDFGLSDEQTLAWHRIEAGQAESDSDWFAAAFHLEHLTAALPQDKALRNRFSTAEAEVLRAAESKAKLNAVGTRWPRDPKAGPEMVDLSNFYNDQTLAGEWPGLIEALPHGSLLLAGTGFDARGLIALASNLPAEQSMPERISAIPVHQKCRELHFLQAAAHGRGLPEDATVGTYIVHFADGEKREIPIRYGDDVADWRVPPNAPFEIKGSVIAWTGSYPAATPDKVGLFRLFKTSLENPRPEVVISTIDFLSAKTKAAPVLLAITAEP